MAADLNRLSLDALSAVLLPSALLRREAARFLAEDEGAGDITSLLTIPASARGHARVVAREACVLAGIDAAAFIATSGRRDLVIRQRRRDGATLRAGAVVAELEGRLRDVLTVERVVLNLLGRMSGIAALTSHFVARARAAAGSRVQVVDTRKTMPGLRAFEKYAVRCGGGMLHRIGLFDAVLVKDNHIAALEGERGGAMAALEGRLSALRSASSAHGRGSTRSLNGSASTRAPSFVEVEVDRLDQLEEILAWPHGIVDIVLLDNMTTAHMRSAVRLRDRAKSRIRLEASGGVRLDSIGAIARTGVDRISVGALTHSARSIDFSLEVDAARSRRGR